MLIKKKLLIIISFFILISLSEFLYAKNDKNLSMISNYYKKNNYKHALDYIQKLTEKYPSNYEYKYQLAYCLYQVERYYESEMTLNNMLKDEWLPLKYKKKVDDLLSQLSDIPERKKKLEKKVKYKRGIFKGKSIILLNLGLGFFRGDIYDLENDFASFVLVYFEGGGQNYLKLTHFPITFGLNYEYLLSNHLGFGLEYLGCVVLQNSDFGPNVKQINENLLFLNNILGQFLFHLLSYAQVDPYFISGIGYSMGQLHTTPVYLKIPGSINYSNDTTINGLIWNIGFGVNFHNAYSEKGFIWGFLIRYLYAMHKIDRNIYLKDNLTNTFIIFDFHVGYGF